MVCAVLSAFAADTDSVAVYVPAGRLPGEACNVSTAGAVVVFSVALSQPVALAY
jgi:hypothetical protein